MIALFFQVILSSPISLSAMDNQHSDSILEAKSENGEGSAPPSVQENLDEPGKRRIQPFCYQPLNTEISEIRLIRLKATDTERDGSVSPGLGFIGDDLEIELHHFSMDRHPPYTALSYTWGDPLAKVPILVNGYRLDITKILANFLRSSAKLVRKGHAVSVWVDAICINQADESERSHQVRRMKSIYAEAYSVMAWLEPGSDHALAVEVVHNIYQGWQRFLRATASWGMIDTMDNLQARYAVTITDSLMGLGARRWEALSMMFSNPWWHRTWIIQETTFNKSTCVVYGSHSNSMDWLAIEFLVPFLGHCIRQPHFRSIPEYKYMHAFTKKVAPAYRILMLKNARPTQEENDVSSTLFRPGYSWIGEISTDPSPTYRIKLLNDGRLRQGECNLTSGPLGQRSVFTLELLLCHFRIAQATLPHDKVYGLLGIAADAEEVKIDVDYSLPFQLIFGQIAKYYIQKSNTLDMLGYCCIRGPGHGCPSWIPDWRYDWPLPLMRRVDSKGKCIYGASGVTQPEVLFSEDLKSLGVQGFWLSTVRIVGETVQLHTGSFPIPLQRSCEDTLATLPDVYFTGEPKWDAYRRTLVADSQSLDDPGCFAITTQRAASAEGPWTGPLLLDPLTPDQEAERRDYALTNMMVLDMRSFGTTTDGHMGLWPLGTMEGDQVCILLGARTPFVIHRWPQHERQCLIGECYVHGFMDGQAMELLESGKLNLETFELF